MASSCRVHRNNWNLFDSTMKNSTKIAVVGLVAIGGLAAGAISIYNQISYDVLSYEVQSIDSNGMIVRIVFGVTNNSRFDLSLWNQEYDVFVSGYKIAEITSKDKYLLLGNNTSLIPLDVQVFWNELQVAAPYLGSQLQVATIASLPFVLHGRLAAKVGLFQLRKIPVRWASTIGYFLP